MGTNTTRRIAEKTSPAEIQPSSSAVTLTTREGIDGYREKTMRIASVEHVELESIMELSVTSPVLKRARQSKLSDGASLTKANGWNLKDHGHLTIAKHLREIYIYIYIYIHPSLLIVTLRESEERGICSAASKELVNINEDQVQERSVVVLVLNKESTIWKDLKYESTVTTCAAELHRRWRTESGPK